MASQPNIIFIHAESMDGRKMGCMGHPAMQNATPNIDRLANEGTIFTNAYTNSPVCTPSRASMWSGKYPNYDDCWNNHEGLEPSTPTYQDTFESSGYQTSAIGPIDYAYGQHSIRDRIGSWTRSANIRRPLCRTPLPKVVNDGEANGRDWNRTYQAVEQLHQYANSERPFWLYLTTGLVHPAFTAEQRHMRLINEAGIDIPSTLMSIEDTKNQAIAYQRITKNCDKQFSEKMVHQIRHIYFAMIAALDEMVGRVLQTIEELGLRDNTYVIFSSDHGEMAGDQNQILKRSMYEASTHVPLIVRGPDIRRGKTIDTPVSLVDLYPTFMDMAGINYTDFANRLGYPNMLDGESLMPQMTGNVKRKRDWAMCEYHGDRCATGTFMIRQGDWKYIKHIGFESELFNITKDSDETTDLIEIEANKADQLDQVLTSNFACQEIDDRAKQYDKESFMAWSEKAKANGTYHETMASVYSGFDRLCIEDISPWTNENEQKIEAWIGI